MNLKINAKSQYRLSLILCWLFAILYGVWLLPNTVAIRHLCMVSGAILGIPFICLNYRLFFQIKSIPIWIILCLFAWITIHLFFFGQEPELQYFEYSRIWKKIAISSLFAAGLGFAVMSQANNSLSLRKCWRILYFGFFLPVIIYFVKLLVTVCAAEIGKIPPDFLRLSSDHLGDPFGISRAQYVFFCLPSLAISLGCLLRHENNNPRPSKFFIYLLPIVAVMSMFYLERDRLGIGLGLLLIGVALITFLKSLFSVSLGKNLLIIGIALALIFSASLWNIFTTPSWNHLLADARVAVQVDQYDYWKSREKWRKSGDFMIRVNSSNYERIAWAVVGTKLLIENPMGYGKLSLSFQSLSKKKWPDSDVSWTHSAWLDFALGYGILGVSLLAAAIILSIVSSIASPFPVRQLGLWGLGSQGLVFLVKEVSTEISLNALIFMIVLISAMGLFGTSAQLPHKNSS